MPSTAPPVSPSLGQLVHHHSDPTKRVGTIIGVLFLPADEALVRWRGGETTFEVLDDLIKVGRAA
jgi:hypothetical protein